MVPRRSAACRVFAEGCAYDPVPRRGPLSGPHIQGHAPGDRWGSPGAEGLRLDQSRGRWPGRVGSSATGNGVTTHAPRGHCRRALGMARSAASRLGNHGRDVPGLNQSLRLSFQRPHACGPAVSLMGWCVLAVAKPGAHRTWAGCLAAHVSRVYPRRHHVAGLPWDEARMPDSRRGAPHHPRGAVGRWARGEGD